MVARTAARSPPPTRAGGQDDGSYTNSLKLVFVLPRVLDVLSMVVYTSHNLLIISHIPIKPAEAG